MIPLRDNIPSSRTPVISYTLIGLNVVAFIFELSLGRHLDAIIRTYGFVPGRFLNQFWYGIPYEGSLLLPLFTSMFLHGGWLHLIGNMWTLYIFGDNVEDTLGRGRYLSLYLLSGIVACFTQLLSAPHSMVPMVGASGAIAGVMGAYFLLFPRARVLTLVPVFLFLTVLEIPAYVFLGFWFLLQFFQGGLSILGPGMRAGVAFWAHVGGFVAGVALLSLFVPRRTWSPFRRGF